MLFYVVDRASARDASRGWRRDLSLGTEREGNESARKRLPILLLSRSSRSRVCVREHASLSTGLLLLQSLLSEDRDTLPSRGSSAVSIESAIQVNDFTVSWRGCRWEREVGAEACVGVVNGTKSRLTCVPVVAAAAGKKGSKRCLFTTGFGCCSSNAVGALALLVTTGGCLLLAR